jgi:hypothetical protein
LWEKLTSRVLKKQNKPSRRLFSGQKLCFCRVLGERKGFSAGKFGVWGVERRIGEKKPSGKETEQTERKMGLPAGGNDTP